MVRKLFLEILLLLATVFLACFAIERRYADFKTPVDYMMEDFEKDRKSARLLLLGNSHMIPVDHYLEESDYRNRFATLAFAGMDLFWCTVLVKKELLTMPDLETVILSIDEEMMGYNQSFFKQNYSNRSFYRYTDTLYKPTASDKLLARSDFFRSNRNTSYLFSGKQENAKDAIKWVNTLRSTQACKTRALEYSVFRFSPDLFHENTELLSELIATVRSSGKKILLVTLPKSSCFLHFRSRTSVEQGRMLIDSIVRSNNVRLLDYTNYPLPDSAFLDADHLNKTGVKVIWNEIEKELHH